MYCEGRSRSPIQTVESYRPGSFPPLPPTLSTMADLHQPYYGVAVQTMNSLPIYQPQIPYSSSYVCACVICLRRSLRMGANLRNLFIQVHVYLRTTRPCLRIRPFQTNYSATWILHQQCPWRSRIP